MQAHIDRTLVHKSSADAVLLSSADKVSVGCWEFEGALPGKRAGEGSPDGLPVLLGMELMRQTAIAYAHLEGQVPLDWALLMNVLDFGWLPEAAHHPAASLLAGTVRVNTQSVRMRREHVSELTLEAEYSAGGVLVAAGHGQVSCLSSTAYRAIRRNAPAVDRHNTGPLHMVLANVHRAGNRLESELVWNWGDAVTFDHFSDHLPGMLLARAMVEAHRQLTGSEPVHVRVKCENFGEFNAPVMVVAQLCGSADTHVTITQADRPLAGGRCSGSNEGTPHGGEGARTIDRESLPH
ncbi:AfsA-related hotdog domain-containing protein [Arthrobacter cavernae]|uniref:A-factor biosynthesis hotdog domain-containing protein n=1 Tax=Arthrobacter cavernae TaxID=2817681 RepID=A0A939HHH2_9MICC|nr:AfsA-related hotdog domain-containing protein [Arthrobacter cavernae]MBO1268072.1 hypothetical protein [Arthrobacter cavernae]